MSREPPLLFPDPQSCSDSAKKTGFVQTLSVKNVCPVSLRAFLGTRGYSSSPVDWYGKCLGLCLSGECSSWGGGGGTKTSQAYPRPIRCRRIPRKAITSKKEECNES